MLQKKKNRIILRLAYKGSRYYGFQRQPNLNTVENCIINSLYTAKCWNDDSLKSYSYGGRTDRGVNAIGQVITFIPSRYCCIDEIKLTIESACPDVVVWGFREEVEPLFNARYWAIYRDYLYIDLVTKYKSDIQNLPALLKILYTSSTFSFVYKDYHNVEKLQSLGRRRILKFFVKKFDNAIGFFIRGESFSYHFIRRLISFLREYKVDFSFEDNVKMWKPSEAEAERLYLLNVKIPYSVKLLMHPSAVAERLFGEELKRENPHSLDLLNYFLSFSFS